jgi:hypothetical protein
VVEAVVAVVRALLAAVAGQQANGVTPLASTQANSVDLIGEVRQFVVAVEEGPVRDVGGGLVLAQFLAGCLSYDALLIVEM